MGDVLDFATAANAVVVHVLRDGSEETCGKLTLGYCYRCRDAAETRLDPVPDGQRVFWVRYNEFGGIAASTPASRVSEWGDPATGWTYEIDPDDPSILYAYTPLTRQCQEYKRRLFA